MLKVYTYAKCSTCRDAVQWLRDRRVPFSELPIKESPPPRAELKAMLKAHGGNLKKLFNTSGLEYRRLGLSERWATVGEDEALGLLAANGMLVKRPFALGPNVALVGFDPRVWSTALKSPTVGALNSLTG